MAARKPKTIAAATEPTEVVTAYKGFNADLTCRGFQFTEGQTFTHKGRVEACASGFHSCTNPLDVWSYYGPAASRFAVVKAGGSIARHSDDSKIASASLHIEAVLSLPDFIRRAVDWVLANAKGNTAVSGHAAATGYGGHAAATGDRGHAAATGDRGHAAATGVSGHAAATGDSGHAAATGYGGHAAATGDSGHAAATGDSGHAAATGDRGHAAATGDRGHAAATGDRGVAVSLGHKGAAMAGPAGWIVLAYCSPAWPHLVERVERFKVGEDGVEAGKSYRLNKDGKLTAVTA